jgi:hypothetical protein
VWGEVARRLLLAAALGIVPGVASAQGYALAWEPNTDPLTAGYRVFAGTRSGVYQWNADVGRVTGALLPELTQAGTYYFAVRAYDGMGGLGAPSTELSITVGPPGAPPDLAASALGSRVSLSWRNAPGLVPASHYLLYVGTQPGTANVVSGFPIGNQLSVSGDLSPGRYYVCVQAANRFGGGPMSSEVAIDVGGLEAPSSPDDVSQTWQGSVVTLRWSAAANATSYIVEAGSRPGAADLARISSPTNQLVVDVPPGTFYVRVRGVNRAGASAPSREITVVGRGAPMPPVGLTARDTGDTVELRWSAPGSGPLPTGYLLEAGSSPGLADLAVLQLGNLLSYTAVAPPNGTYYLRLRAVNGRGRSDVSNEVAVTVSR